MLQISTSITKLGAENTMHDLHEINSFLIICYDMDGLCYQFMDKKSLLHVPYFLQLQIGYFLHNQSYLEIVSSIQIGGIGTVWDPEITN